MKDPLSSSMPVLITLQDAILLKNSGNNLLKFAFKENYILSSIQHIKDLLAVIYKTMHMQLDYLQKKEWVSFYLNPLLRIWDFMVKELELFI